LDLASISIWLIAIALIAISFGSLIKGMTGLGSNLWLVANHRRHGRIALVPTLLFTRLSIGLAGRISNTVFQRLLLVIFVLMEIKLLTDVVSD
jgi:hypothetical protein